MRNPLGPALAAYKSMVARAGEVARFPFRVHSHMLRHSCGYKLANDGQDTRAIRQYLSARIDVYRSPRGFSLRRNMTVFAPEPRSAARGCRR